MKSIVLADCDEKELAEFLEAIKKENIDISCYSVIANGSRDGKFSNLIRYFKYFSAPISILFRRKKFDYIIGWQQFYALIFCFWCQLFHVKKMSKVIVMNFTYKQKKGFTGKIYKWFMQKCICNDYLDYLHVLSSNYARVISEEFGILEEKFVVTPFGIDDVMSQYGDSALPERAPENGYALAIGRSNRDYDFLIEVWKGINANLVIISDEYLRKAVPDNVMLINDVSGDVQYPWISNASCIIMPIDNVEICSGDTVLLTAMAFAKMIFVTNPSTLAEMYVEDKVDSYYISKDVNETRRIINEFMFDRDSNVGLTARRHFLEKYSRFTMGQKIAKLIV